MVHTIRTNSINRGRGRGRGANGRRVPGIGIRRDSVDSRHSSATSSHNRAPGGNHSQSVRSNPAQGSGHARSPMAPRPTQAELEGRIESLQGINEELQNELAYVKWDSNRTERMLHNLQLASVRKGTEMEKLLEERDGLREERDLLRMVLAQEKRIATRTWGNRVRDRSRFFKRVAKEYAGVVKGYFASWIHSYGLGPEAKVFWNFKPSVTFAQYIRDPYLPTEF